MKPTSLVSIDVLSILYHVRVIDRHWDNENESGVEVSELSKSSRRVFYLSRGYLGLLKEDSRFAFYGAITDD
jgi:hypothetical protein